MPHMPADAPPVDFWSTGTGSPEGVVTADIGAVYLRSDGGTSSTMYIKESGTGNTGWVAVGSAVAADTVTLAMMANLATDRLIGRDTAGTGDPEALTVGGGLEFTGSAGIQRSALTGDVTASAGSNATTIANDAVTNAKLANVSTATFKGRTTSGTGDPEDLTVTQATALLNEATATVKGLVPTPPNNTTTFLRGDATFAALPKQKLYLFFGGDTFTAGDQDRFANPAGIGTTPLGTNGNGYHMPAAGTLTKTHYRVTVAHTTNTVTVIPRVNGVQQTTQTQTISAADTFESTTHATPLALAASDFIACQMDHNGATNIRGLSVIFEIELD